MGAARQIRTDPDTWSARYWKRAEVDRLKELIDEGYGYEAIARRLGRTETAVRLKSKKVRYRLLTSRSALTCQDVTRMLGIGKGNSKTVTLWIQRYGLKARNARRADFPLWRIQWLDLMTWLEDPRHWMAYNPARVTEAPLREHLTEIRLGQPRWLTIGEVAKRYCVGVKTVGAWRDKGLIPMTRYGNWWVRESDLVGWVPPCERDRRAS